MKRLICGVVVMGSVLAARAQWLPPESFGGALWGAMLGGILGSDCHHGFSGTGAAIGAGVGFIAGTIAGEARRGSGEAYPAYTTVSVSAGYPTYVAPYVSYAPNRYCPPSYYFRPAGAAISVSTTLVAAGHTEKTARPASRPTRGKQPSAAVTPETATTHASQSSDCQSKPGHQKPAARSHTTATKPVTFAARGIPDAPRVPDAPTF